MNTKKKRIASKKRLIKRFITLMVVGSLLMPGLLFMSGEKVEANPIVDMASGVIGKIRYNTTVAELIVSLLTGSGASVTNTNWLNQINTSYGVNSTLATATGTDGTLGAMYEAGLFSIDSAGHYIDNGLADAIRAQSAYNSAGVSTLFETTATDMELGAWQTADAATNLGEAAAAGVTLGTIGQVFGAVSLGVNLGVLANKVINWVGNKMAYGAFINSDANFSNIGSIPSGYNLSWGRIRGESDRESISYATPSNIIPIVCTAPQSGNFYYVGYYIYNKSTNSLGFYYANNYYSYTNIPNPTSSSSLSPNGLRNYLNKAYVLGHEEAGFVRMDFSSKAEMDAWIESVASKQIILDDEKVTISSPDVVGRNGNQRPSNYSDINNPSSWPYLNPNETLQDSNTGIKPIPWNDYQDFVQTVNNNTENNITNITQGDVYNNFIENYIQEPEINDSVETPDYNPTVPEQPVPNPKEELTSEVIQDNTDYMTTPGLKDVFPFSIPWDIAGLFNIFSTNNREAPVITFPIVSELFGIDEEVTIDLSPYDDIAALFRLLELIAFGLGLAFVTRYLIGAGG